MSASENKAVFLSYASQDAAAVRRIAEALRAAGVEVWFDQNELVGGDAWDQKIRAQIKSCALFVPVISAATQARREGYFRLEWKLAAQRTHMISERQAFLLPVVIDGTSDAAADVPEEFRAVQWTRLPGGEGAAVEKFCARVGRLLGGDAVAAVPGAGARPGRTREDGRGPAPLRKLAPGAIGVAVLVGAAVAIWPPWKNSAPAGPMKPEASSNPAGAPQIGASAAAQLAEQAYRLTQKVSLTRDDLDAADGLARRAAELEPQSPRVWAVRAWVEAAYVERRCSRRTRKPRRKNCCARPSKSLRAIRAAESCWRMWCSRGDARKKGEACSWKRCGETRRMWPPGSPSRSIIPRGRRAARRRRTSPPLWSNSMPPSRSSPLKRGLCSKLGS